MAKATLKSATEKKPVKRAPSKAQSLSIETASEGVLEKLKALSIEPQLQADLEWCLGSYRYDGNPVGLVDALTRAIGVLKAAQAKKTKGVTGAFITSIEKVLA